MGEAIEGDEDKEMHDEEVDEEELARSLVAEECLCRLWRRVSGVGFRV